jgi:Bacterial protein of unknown function (DUF885)
MSARSAPMFAAWLDDFFASYYRRRPVNATFIGVHDYDDALPDVSESGMAETLGDAEWLLRRLRDLPREPLDSAEHLDRQLAEGFLLIQRWELTSQHFGWRNPSLFTGEAIFGVIGLLLQDRPGSAAARLEAIPAFLSEAGQHPRAAPRAWIDRARRECTGARLLLANLELPAAAAAADAFARFAALVEGLQATDDYACGGEAFEVLLRYGHFLDMSTEELERIALERMAEEAATLADCPAPPSALAKASPGGRGRAYLQRYSRLWERARELAEQRDVLTFPDWPVRFIEQPTWVREAAKYLYFLPYRSPPALHAPRVVNYFAPGGADGPTIKLNHVVHHGSLGHHVQNWHAARAASRIGRIAAVDCASRIAMLCGGTMAEGWACYATDLADEAGFLTVAEQHVHHQTRLRMAARAVVDIRLHHGRMSLGEAAAFYAERVGMPTVAARAEAVKNSLFPGTACMYLAGWEGIRNLRSEAQPASLREFHDRLLSFGSVPVSLVADALTLTFSQRAREPSMVKEEICL